MKNSRNESNISIKKYHQSPTFGVKSGRRSCTPYVEEMNSQDPPFKALEMYSSQAIPAEKTEMYVASKVDADGGVFVVLAT